MGKKFGLIIGNSEYQDDRLARLVAPAADVAQLAAVLKDPEIGEFDVVESLVNELADTVRRAIARFFKERKPDDLLLLYFSGHGVRDDQGSLYLTVKDTDHDLLTGTALPAAFITSEMDRSRSRRKILILDCCHSGAFAQGAKGVPGESAGTAAAFQGIGAGRVVLTATDATQYAWEGDQVVGEAQNSVFTKYLIKGLQTGEADTAGDGLISVDELYDYIYEQVVSVTPKQVPGKWSYNQQGEIVLARNPHPVAKPVDFSPELQQTIDDQRTWVRQSAISPLQQLLNGSNPRLALAAQNALEKLADDDSRSIASAAARVLAEYSAQVRANEEEEEAARRARKQAEQERLARAEAEEQLEERERSANAPAAQEPPAKVSPASEQTSSSPHSILRSRNGIWLPLLLAEIVWTLAVGIIGANGGPDWLTNFFILNGLAVSVVGGAFLWARTALPQREIRILLIGLSIGLFVQYLAAWLLGDTFRGLVYETITPRLGFLPETRTAVVVWTLTAAVLAIIGGMIGAAVIAWELQNAKRYE